SLQSCLIGSDKYRRFSPTTDSLGPAPRTTTYQVGEATSSRLTPIAFARSAGVAQGAGLGRATGQRIGPRFFLQLGKVSACSPADASPPAEGSGYLVAKASIAQLHTHRTTNSWGRPALPRCRSRGDLRSENPSSYRGL